MTNNLTKSNFINYATLILGLWLIIAPFILGYVDSTAITNDIILGLLIAAVSVVRLFTAFRPNWLNWLIFALGLWLIIAPFIFGYFSPAPRSNDIIVGILVAVLGAWNAIMGER